MQLLGSAFVIETRKGKESHDKLLLKFPANELLLDNKIYKREYDCLRADFEDLTNKTRVQNFLLLKRYIQETHVVKTEKKNLNKIICNGIHFQNGDATK